MTLAEELDGAEGEGEEAEDGVDDGQVEQEEVGHDRHLLTAPHAHDDAHITRQPQQEHGRVKQHQRDLHVVVAVKVAGRCTIIQSATPIYHPIHQIIHPPHNLTNPLHDLWGVHPHGILGARPKLVRLP